MKKIYILIATLLMTASTFAQSPEKFNYQAVVRDADGAELVSTTVSFRIKLRNSQSFVVYEEVHDRILTDEFGRVNIEIGGGLATSGSISEIDWSTDTYSIMVELDATGGTNYVLMGAAQLLSVPYALHAKTAGKMLGDSIFINRDIVSANQMSSIYGQNAKALLESASDSMNLKDFILKLFFPATAPSNDDNAPTILSFTYGSGTSSTVPYSVWSTWATQGGAVSFNYSIVNQTLLDPAVEDVNILSIQLIDADNLTSVLASESPIPAATASGFISDNISTSIQYPSNATDDYTVNYILKVSDGINTVYSSPPLSITLEKVPTTSAPTAPSITSFTTGTGTTSPIPYSTWSTWVGGKSSVSFNYSITNRSKQDLTPDADILSIKLVNNNNRSTVYASESPIPTEVSGVITDNISYEITSPDASNMTTDYVVNHALEVQDGTNTVYSPTSVSITLQKPTVTLSPLYRAMVTNNPCNMDGSTNLTETAITSAAIETKNGGDWFDASGYSFTFGTTPGYYVFAFPTVASGDLQVYSFGMWMTMTPGGDGDYTIDEIQMGSETYKIYCACGEQADVTFNYRIIE